MRLVLIGTAGLLTLIWVLASLVKGTGPDKPVAPGPPGDGSWLPPEGGAMNRDASAISIEGVPSPASPATSGTLQTGVELAATPADAAITAVGEHGGEAAAHVHSEEEPADHPVWSAIPADTPAEVLEALAVAVAAQERSPAATRKRPPPGPGVRHQLRGSDPLRCADGPGTTGVGSTPPCGCELDPTVVPIGRDGQFLTSIVVRGRSTTPARVVSVSCPSDNPKRPNTTRLDDRPNPLSRMGFLPIGQ